MLPSSAWVGCWWHGGGLEGSVAAAMVAGTSAFINAAPSGPLVLLAFCGTLLVYHVDRIPALSPEDQFSHPARWRWRRQHPAVSGALALGAVLGALWTLPHLRTRTLGAGVVLALPALGYALPVWGGHGGRRRLKDVGPIKPFAVAAAWAAGSVLLPAFEARGLHAVHGPGLALLGGYRFLFVLPNLLLADAADSSRAAPAEAHVAFAGWAPRRLRRWAVGTLACTVAGGGLALLFFEAPPLLAVDLAGPVWLLGCVAVEGNDRRLAHVADVAMLGPALTAVAAALA